MYKSSFVITVSIITSLTNFWIWRIIEENTLLGSFLVLLSTLLIYLFFIKFDKKIFMVATLFMLIIGYQVLASGFDKNLTVLTPDQERKLNERHAYFAVDLGNLFQNKFALRFYKNIYPYLNIYENNIFNSLSPNLYFFINHPREREKVEEFAKYPSIMLIPFLLGLISIFKSSQNLIFLYLIFALFLTGFVKQTYIFGPILLFPLINLLITIGLFKIHRIFRKNGI